MKSSSPYDAERVMNGYGINTSKLSITHIGTEPRAVRYQMTAEQYRNEAIGVGEETKRRHGPANRSPHLQQTFPVTRRLLQPPHGRMCSGETPRELKDVTFPPHNNHRTKWEKDEKPFSQIDPAWCQTVVSEKKFGTGNLKQLLRRNEATNVNYIIAQRDRDGNAFKAGTDTLFPQNASHMYLLQLTKSACAPDPRIAPQPPPKRPTWGGMDVGWSNHP